MSEIIKFPSALRARENNLKEREIKFNIKYHNIQRELKELNEFKFNQRLYTVLSFFMGMVMSLIFLS
tara:strand:- start:101 stop:301 length:201 start_codon:yes stop_codon:yes gene_type:complete